MILETSGSSGIPKTFEVSDELIRRRAISRVCKGPHFYQLSSVLCLLRPGSTAYLAHQEFFRMSGAHFYDRNCVIDDPVQVEGVIGQPTDLLQMFNMKHWRNHFKVVLCGGDQLNPTDARLIAQLLAPGGDGVVSYGASEVGTIAVGTLARATEIRGCVGKLCAGVEVKFVSKRILVRTEAMIERYENMELTNRHFTTDGFFISGDRGWMLEDNTLVVAARL